MARKQMSHNQARNAPILRRFQRSFRWAGIELEPYKLAANRSGEFRGASRQVLIGKLGEKVKFHVRYFELEARGFTSLERHHHPHVVIGVRGRGHVQVANRKFALGPMDTIYIAPDQAHQLRASREEPFGFFCIVDARRDRPRPVRP